MKNLLVNYVFVLLILTVLFSCQEKNNQQDGKKNVSLTTKTTLLTSLEDSIYTLFKLSEDDLAELKKNKNNFTSNPFINQEEAKRRIRAYKWDKETLLSRLKIPVEYDAKKDVYGFTFDLGNMKSFMTKIEEYNKAIIKDSLKINGVRVYNSIRPLGNGKFTPEVFLVPTIKGFNLYDDIDDDFNSSTKQIAENLKFYENKKGILPPTDDIILDSSSPCPNNCSQH